MYCGGSNASQSPINTHNLEGKNGCVGSNLQGLSSKVLRFFSSSSIWVLGIFHTLKFMENESIYSEGLAEWNNREKNNRILLGDNIFIRPKCGTNFQPKYYLSSVFI